MIILRLFLMLLLLIFCNSCPVETPEPENPWADLDHIEFVSSMKIGWNLGNALDAHINLTPGETAWGNLKTSQALLNSVAAQGFGAVRIPVTWGTMIGSAPHYTINAAWLDRVAEVVEYVRSAGMRAIINIHHDGADSQYWLSVKTADLTGTAKAAIDAQFTAVWKQIAGYFKGTGNYLLFEGFNELHDGSWGNGSTAQRNRVNELNQMFVNTVRAVGGENSSRYLVIHGWVTRPSITVSSLVIPQDSAKNRIIVGIHYYDPYDFAGSASVNTWGSKSLTGSDGWANESYLQNTFNAVKEKFTDNGIPVIIGEYGAVRQRNETGRAHRLYYMEYVTKYASDCGFIPFYWDNGASKAGSEGFGLFSRSSPYGLVADAADVIAVMMKAVNNDYLFTDIIVP